MITITYDQKDMTVWVTIKSGDAGFISVGDCQPEGPKLGYFYGVLLGVNYEINEIKSLSPIPFQGTKSLIKNYYLIGCFK